MPAPIGIPNQLSGGSRLTKEPHFDQTVFDNGLLCQPVCLPAPWQAGRSTGRPELVFRQSWTLAPAGAWGIYINWLMPCEHEFVQEEEAEEFAEALKNEIKEHGE